MQHDFTLGPWWPAATYDAVWTTEFVEHISHPYMQNYLPVMHQATFVFMTASGMGGWHHTEVQSAE